MNYIKDLVDKEAQDDFIIWIYNLITGFMKSIGLNHIPKSHLLQEGDEMYFGIISGSEEGTVIWDSNDTNDYVYTDELDNKFIVVVTKPLHKRINSNKVPEFLGQLADNLKEIAVYGIHNIEREIFEKLKENEISITDRYTLIPLNVKIGIDDAEGHDYPNDLVFSTYELYCETTFDFVDEEEYHIGGAKYNEGEIRFFKRQY